MSRLLASGSLTDADRRAHDRHCPRVVVAVLAVLFVYMYFFTHVADVLHLPRPQVLAEALGLQVKHVFDDDRNVNANFVISMSQRYEHNDDERLVFLLLLTGAFLCAYFLPVRSKQGALVLWTVVAIVMLYGARATFTLIAAHLVAYLLLHRDGANARVASVLAGVAAYGAFFHDYDEGALRLFPAVAVPLLFALVYHFVVRRLLTMAGISSVLQACAVHAAVLTIGAAMVVEGLGGDEWKLSVGVMLFFWQWARLTMYFIDFRDGLVPKDLSLDRYLAVFFSPAVLPNWGWGVTIGQGYAYVDSVFLSQEKNRIVLDGLILLGVALLYLVLWDWLRYQLVDLFALVDIDVYRANTRHMVRQFMAGADVSGASVLATTFLDLLRFFLFFGSVVHLKVGIWRICGYAVAPYYNRPWLATDLMNLWGRFAFHYREFMVRAFYYPTFFRVFRRRPMLRVFVASMAAACAGNMIWHASERVLFRGVEVDSLQYVLGTWPYFVLLGLGIGFTQLYLMRRRRRRRPWTLDGWIVRDILAAYLTLQYFALIHVFARPAAGSTEWDLMRLFLRVFGIHFPG